VDPNEARHRAARLNRVRYQAIVQRQCHPLRVEDASRFGSLRLADTTRRVTRRLAIAEIDEQYRQAAR
jgi:hypothetical protein